MANQTLKSVKNVAVVCGGVSSEHEISCVSAGSIMQARQRAREAERQRDRDTKITGERKTHRDRETQRKREIQRH